MSMILNRIIGPRFINCSSYFIKTSPDRSTHTMSEMKYLNQTDAAALDQDLFNEYKFSVDQLMELAGLSCASAIAKTYLPEEHSKVLIVCGPGNNGGDGLVAARHLHMMGFAPSVHYPKRPANTLYQNLTHQCLKYGVEFVDKCPTADDINSTYNIVVDALFGFSFKPPIRPEMMPQMEAMANTSVPVCSVDIPSGWNVNDGPPTEGPVLSPTILISLSAPKKCAKSFTGLYHYLGGRFVPPGLVQKYNLRLPRYPDTEQVVLLSK
ncbi:NAD(P)HX epimerase isoform X2 [Arctopsyche grandis]|uniref:NAD(P)HX epimerase isoform X2 n=1 Tax=Arctopsyche grandis TaxID=121162 RepID=UPI00406DA346